MVLAGHIGELRAAALKDTHLMPLKNIESGILFKIYSNFSRCGFVETSLTSSKIVTFRRLIGEVKNVWRDVKPEIGNREHSMVRQAFLVQRL